MIRQINLLSKVLVNRIAHSAKTAKSTLQRNGNSSQPSPIIQPVITHQGPSHDLLRADADFEEATDIRKKMEETAAKYGVPVNLSNRELDTAIQAVILKERVETFLNYGKITAEQVPQIKTLDQLYAAARKI